MIKRGLIATAVGFGGFLALASPAVATVTTVEKAESIPVVTPVEISAKCGKGTRAISAGWAASDPESGVRVFESYRTGPRRWMMRGWRINGSESPATLTMTVFCDTKTKGFKGKSEDIFLPAGTAQTIDSTIKCPGNRTAVSGGVAQPGLENSDSAIIRATNRAGNHKKWKTTVSVGTGSEDRTVTAYAYCIKRDPLDKVQATGTATTSASPVVTPECAKLPRSFGYKVTSGPSAEVLLALGRTGKNAWADIISYQPSDPKIKIFGYC